MLEQFSLSFGALDLAHVKSASDLQQFGPRSMKDGLYRVLSPKQIEELHPCVALAFPAVAHESNLFAVDWAGRAFLEKDATIYICEPGSGECFNTEASFSDFHNIELVEFAESSLLANLYQRWRESGGRAPSDMECVGFSKPLFLGGIESVENLEILNLHVYWGILSQLVDKTRAMPVGEKLGHIEIHD